MFIFIIVVVVILAALMCYAFFTQSVQKKQKQHKRLTGALKVRSKDFMHMAEGFPPGLLPKELNTLILRSLVDVLEQLSNLEPKEKDHADNLRNYKIKLQQSQSGANTEQRQKIQNPQQVNEVKQLLKGLNNFLGVLLKKGSITSKEHVAYDDQIKMVLLEMSIDTQLLYAQQASAVEKTKLAIHYYGLAKKLMLKGSEKKDFREQIQDTNAKIAELQAQQAQEDQSNQETPSAAPQPAKTDTEWDEFDSEEDADWKKKSIYD